VQRPQIGEDRRRRDKMSANVAGNAVERLSVLLRGPDGALTQQAREVMQVAAECSHGGIRGDQRSHAVSQYGAIRHGRNAGSHARDVGTHREARPIGCQYDRPFSCRDSRSDIRTGPSLDEKSLGPITRVEGDCSDSFNA
jgi:hypothetical protein